MSTEHGNAMPVDHDHHAAVLKALHEYEAAWAAYEWHFRHNNDPNRKEQRGMTQIIAIWEKLTVLGAVDDNGDLNYSLSPAERDALKQTYRVELARLQTQAQGATT